MLKRLTLTLAIVAAFAFAVPALASASSVTASAGTLAPVGTALSGTGSGVTLSNNVFGPFKCGTLSFNATLSKNDGSSFEASGENAATQECAAAMLPTTVTSFNVSNLSSTTSGSGTASFSVKQDIGALTCAFTASSAPFTYTAGGSSITFSEVTLSSTPTSCGKEKLSGTFALSAAGSAVILD